MFKKLSILVLISMLPTACSLPAEIVKSAKASNKRKKKDIAALAKKVKGMSKGSGGGGGSFAAFKGGEADHPECDTIWESYIRRCGLTPDFKASEVSWNQTVRCCVSTAKVRKHSCIAKRTGDYEDFTYAAEVLKQSCFVR